ncbi:potassium channel subfamily K member 18-like [Periplaneta americana]|uniref:potassium channel subfamily K member 18-like n=1 Tax=Periplaneta americana TaxID=6978 RepID=UPI0037E94F2E
MLPVLVAGYGSVAPRTPWGKVITIIYALIGIPLMLVYLSTVGDVLARNFRRLYGRLCGNGGGAGGCNGRNNAKNSSGKSKLPSGGSSAESYLSTGYTPAGAAKAHNSIAADGSAIKMHHYRPPGAGDDDMQAKLDRSGSVVVLDCGGDGIGASSASSSTALDPGGKRLRHCEAGPPPCPAEPVRVPISLCLLIILMYICGGALLFNRLENWTFLEGSYFCFTSLGTIGFGDLIPGLYHSYQVQYQSSASHSSAEQLSVFASSAYILVGMALIAMCFNLVQDEVVIIVRRLGNYFGVTGSSTSGSSNSRGGDADDEDVMLDVVDGEGIAMAVVSSSATSS